MRTANMQKRHFEFIAATLRGSREYLNAADHNLLVRHFANDLEATNARFNRARFYEAATASHPAWVAKAAE